MSARASVTCYLVTCVALWLLGCAGDTRDPFAAEALNAQAEEHPRVGLFTPGNRIGFMPAETEDGEVNEVRAAAEEAIALAGMSDRCELPEGGEGTPGTLHFSFGTATYDGFYAPENCGAVWIEDAEGRYIKTPMIWAEVRLRNLFVWQALRCEESGPDVISAATLSDHSTVQEGTWDGTDHMGRVVPDGTYVLNIEVTEDEFDYGPRAQIQFEKGPEPVTVQGEDSQSVVDAVLTFTPEGAAAP